MIRLCKGCFFLCLQLTLLAFVCAEEQNGASSGTRTRRIRHVVHVPDSAIKPAGVVVDANGQPKPEESSSHREQEAALLFAERNEEIARFLTSDSFGSLSLSMGGSTSDSAKGTTGSTGDGSEDNSTKNSGPRRPSRGRTKPSQPSPPVSPPTDSLTRPSRPTPPGQTPSSDDGPGMGDGTSGGGTSPSGACTVEVDLVCKTSEGRACNTLEPPSKSQCAVGWDIGSVTFSFQDFTCDPSANGQGSEASCYDMAEIPFNGPVSVSCSSGSGGSMNVSPSTVGPGDLFTVTSPGGGSLPNSISCTITDSYGVTLQTNNINTSGSVPLQLGDKFGAMDLESCDDITCVEEVVYDVVVSNTGTNNMEITVVDFYLNGGEQSLLDQVGINPLMPGQSTSIEVTEVVDLCATEDYIARVDVEANPPSNKMCQDEDEFQFGIAMLAPGGGTRPSTPGGGPASPSTPGSGVAPGDGPSSGGPGSGVAPGGGTRPSTPGGGMAGKGGTGADGTGGKGGATGGGQGPSVGKGADSGMAGKGGAKAAGKGGAKGSKGGFDYEYEYDSAGGSKGASKGSKGANGDSKGGSKGSKGGLDYDYEDAGGSKGGSKGSKGSKGYEYAGGSKGSKGGASDGGSGSKGGSKGSKGGFAYDYDYDFDAGGSKGSKGSKGGASDSGRDYEGGSKGSKGSKTSYGDVISSY